MDQEPNLAAKLRFDVYEVDASAGELRRDGIRIPLEERPFRCLLILLRRAGQVVTRDELKRDLWPPDLFIDFDHGLNTVVRKVRVALNDRSDEPRFIATVGRRGYRFLGPVEVEAPPPPAVILAQPAGTAAAAPAPAPAPIAAPQRQPVAIAGMAASLCILLAVLGYWLRPATPRPLITDVEQLTTAGGAWYLEPMYADAQRVYYQGVGTTEAEWKFLQVVLRSRLESPTSVPAGRFRIRGLSHDGTLFLATTHGAADHELWTVPVSGGEPRRLSDLIADDAAWSHDGTLLLYSKGSRLFLAQADGTAPRPLAAVPDADAEIDHVRWSPDDRLIRFTLYTATTAAIWEVRPDGGGLHALSFPWPGNPVENDGDWTPDGRYFIFRSRRGGSWNLWALVEKTEWWRRPERAPVQLTFGPLTYYQPVPAADGRGILAIGVQPSGELVRYDAAKKDFVPFLGGDSIDHLRYSNDRRWVAYVRFPEGTLWRARSDGSEPLQLTFAPSQVVNVRWSADGRRLAFDAREPGKLLKAYVISVDGGTRSPLPDEPFSQSAPEWIPRTDALLYSRAYGVEQPANIALFRTEQGHTEKVAGSEGLYHPMWSPDGRHLAAMEDSTSNLYLFDLHAGKRTLLAPQIAWPTWSPDSRYLYYMRQGQGIMRVPIAGGAAEKVLEVPFRMISGYFSFAPDGSLVMGREHGRYDVYLLTLSAP
jgi:Tol biopolymer transport system component/DNA-binding winged helix-turn-helix (wHTH) protein